MERIPDITPGEILSEEFLIPICLPKRGLSSLVASIVDAPDDPRLFAGAGPPVQLSLRALSTEVLVYSLPKRGLESPQGCYGRMPEQVAKLPTRAH